jgi:ferric-dicitrate binding protein FerR (iron transport regulator)
MNRVEELSLKLTEGELPVAERDELERLLAQDPEAAATHLELLQIEAGLRARRKNLDLAAAVVSQLKSLQTERLVGSVMANIKEAAPACVPIQDRRCRTLRRFIRESRRWLIPTVRVLPGWRIQTALAAALSIIVGLGFWFPGPVMGEPVLAEVRGNGLTIERGAEVFAGAPGTGLRPGDVLRTGTEDTAVIAFGAERTHLELSGTTELRLDSLAGGKRFHLRQGRLEATVVRQRPFSPMVISTPLAVARVLGTEFVLAVTPDATRLDVTRGRVALARPSPPVAIKVGAGEYAIAANGVELKGLPRTGRLLREWWTGIPGAQVNHLLYHANYPVHPSARDFVEAFESPEIRTNNVGCRLVGYVHPPVTGEYTFWIAASGDAVLWFSMDEDPANKVRIAAAPGGEPRDWDAQPRARGAEMPKSPRVALLAGRRYFIQAVLKTADRPGHLSVAWQRPGGQRELLSGEFLSPFEP